jgi:hypothetical protein
MATDLGHAKSTPTSKYDALVAAQLAQAEKRIRMLDLLAGLLGLTALALVYIVGLVLADSKLMLAPQTRQLALYGFLAGSAVYLFFAVIRPLRLRVNPYYAARQVEQQLPHAKNSIVNWVDLHEQPLPAAIRGALGQRAAKDLARVDLDQAISGRRAAWMGGIAGVCALAFVLAFFLVGPAPFLSLLKRAFNPFAQVGVSTRTQLTLLKPEGGNATLTLGRGINFVVAVNGKVPSPKAPDAVKLLFRYEESDPWLERLLIQEPSREWTTSLSAIEVKNGFWYRITGGDASTEEYRVSVRAAPAITDFLATYHFRPYVARADEVRRQRELKELRGTEVRLRVRTNRNLRDGRLEFEGKNKTERCTIDPAQPDTLLVSFLLEQDGRYRLHFTSTDGEAYSDPVSYPVTAIPDNPPTVELTKPGEDIRLPADALLQLEGKASDDIGVKSLELQMQVVGGQRLRSQRYRSDEELRLPDGGYPRELEYKDYVELARVKDQEGKPVSLRAGMELEYWLEASDACDYPQPNLVQSKHYRVFLTEPEKKEEKQQQDKQKAEKEKQQHKQKQDQKLQEESKERQEQRQNQEAHNKEEENKSKEAGNGGAGGEQSQEKNEQQSNDSGNKEQGGQPGEGKSGTGEDNKLAPEDQQTEDQIKKALQQKESKEGKGEGKPDAGANQGAGQNSSPGEKSQAENKGAGQQDAKQAGESKDKGQPQAGANPSKGEGKGDNAKPQPGAGDTGESKGKPEQAQQPGESKSGGGNAQASKDAGQGKPQPMGQGAEAAQGDSKPADTKDQKSPRETAGEAKGKGSRKNEEKQGSASTKEGPTSPDSRSTADKTQSKQTAKSESKPDAGAQARNATSKDIEELARQLESKDAQEREGAQRRLQQIQKEAGDPSSREKAEEALAKAGQPEGPADSGSPQRNNNSAGNKGTEKKNGQGEAGSKDGREPGPKGTGEKTPGSAANRGKNGPDKQGADSRNTGEGTQASQGGNRAGGGNRRDGEGDGQGNSDASPAPGKRATPREHGATQLQLEDFAKRVNKDILKDAGISEEAWNKYLQAKRKQLQTRETPRPDAPVTPQQASRLPSMGGKTIQSSPSGQTDTHGPDRGQPPPGYRDPYRKFSRDISEKK